MKRLHVSYRGFVQVKISEALILYIETTQIDCY